MGDAPRIFSADDLPTNPIKPMRPEPVGDPEPVECVPVADVKPRPVEVHWLDLARLILWQGLKNKALDLVERKGSAGMDWKQFGVKFVVSLLMNVFGTAFATVGITQGSIEEIVGGLVALIVGVAVKRSLVNQAHNAPTPR